MSEQALDLRRSAQILRRHKILVGIVVILGALAGGVYAAANPPLLTSTALVILPQSAKLSRARRSSSTARPIPIRSPSRSL
jgi:uncharacterized protein involved in exopolysaccharide biosynthesis